MDAIANILRDFSNAISSSWGQIIVVVTLLTILAIVFLVGWWVNRPKPYRAEVFLRTLRARYERGEIPEKEYKDVKREIEEPLYQLKNYLKIYR